MERTLDEHELQRILPGLHAANRQFLSQHGQALFRSQPVHTVYGGAHLFRFDTAIRLGKIAHMQLQLYAPQPETLAASMGFDRALEDVVYARVVDKLTRAPIEDFRIDFEDGYGYRSQSEEDTHAHQAAIEVARGIKENTLPGVLGIRIKALSDELCQRSFRTLDIFLTALLRNSGGLLPSHFVVTLPKVTVPEQVLALAQALAQLESKRGIPVGRINIELMVETCQAILGADGASPLRAMVNAAQGRCVGMHFGAYDYAASCDITAAHQRLDHPACDLARQIMQVALSQTGVALSDGATQILPIGPHRRRDGNLTPVELQENQAVVHQAWRLHYNHVRRALIAGFYQGWDLHPAQLPARYAAIYAFFLENQSSATARLRAFLDTAAQATLLGQVFDDAATGQGLLNFFLRGLGCGALAEADVQAAGLSLNELVTRSFSRIIAERDAASSS